MRWPFFKAGRSFFPANAIAVDLGTANTLIYVKGEGIVLNEPSVVAIEKATGKVKGIGLEAKRMLGRTPDSILAVRPLKDGVIADFDVTEKMLRYFLKTIIDRHVFRVRPKVIVCVPSGITEVERRAVRDSAETAGAKQVLMVAEPMAAAIGVGLPVETPTGNMVIDIGGGTTEIAVIALSGIVSDTSIRTGGDELDQAIVQFMRKNYNLLVGEPTAEAIKIKIGSAAPTGDEREMEVKGRDLVSGIPKTVRVHSTEIREAVQEPIQQIVDAVRRALEITPPALVSAIMDRGTVMTGAGALLGLQPRLGTPYVPAEVLHQSAPTDSRMLLVRVPQRVAPFEPVISADGLVGVVSTAGPDQAAVMTWAHPDFRVSAFSADGRVFGMVAPAAGGNSGEGGLKFRSTSYRDTVAVGTEILSSGLG